MNAIRAAMLPGTTADALAAEIEGELGAQATLIETPPAAANTTGDPMSASQTTAGQAPAAASTLIAIAAAASDSGDAFQAAMNRVNTILSADGVKGDAARMTAAIDLANAAPSMAAEAIVAFVTANVSAGASTPASAAPAASVAPLVASGSYEQQRVAAAALAMPGTSGQQESGLRAAVSARIAAIKPSN
ncbi:MAG: hypothetical protein JZU55_00770 [Afipia sp.]|nr:hypothetical protein [Afipia sp.]